MRGTTVRAAGTVTLVAALLGSAFALGRSLVPDPSHDSTAVTNPHYADQPPTTADSPSPPYKSPPYASPPYASPMPDGGQPVTGEGPFGSRVSTGSARVALTFDDGPDPQYTPEVLALLRQYGVKATFCVVGQNAETHPDLIRAIVAGGHTLCNHSWNHDVTLGNRTPEAILDDLLRTNDAIRTAAPNARIAYFRQPGGAWTYPVVSICEELGMTPLHWAVDPSDWKAPGAASITAAVLGGTAPGSIVLMHDGGGDRQGTVDALQDILPELRYRYQLESLPTGTT